MTITRPPRSYAKIGEDLVRVAAFLQQLGLARLRGRLKTYSDVLAAASSGQAVERQLLWAAAVEVDDLVKLTELAPQALGPVRHRLPGLFAGDPVPLAANGDDPGRSLAFELVTGAMLQRLGSRSTFESPADVGNTIASRPLMVECKRPTTATAMAKRLQEGFRQLSEHRRAGHQGFGAVALDVSAIVNPDFGVLVDQDAPAMLYGHLQRILAEAKDHLARGARNARADADVQILMMRIKCMTGDGVSTPNVTEIWQLQPLMALDSPEFAALYAAMQRHPAFTPGVSVLHSP